MCTVSNDELTLEVTPGTGTNALQGSFDNESPDQNKDFEMDLPLGSQILNQAGEVVATIEEGGNKAKVRVAKRDH